MNRIKKLTLIISLLAITLSVSAQVPTNCGVDSTASFVYWTDSINHEVWRANVDGTNATKLTPEGFRVAAVDVDLSNSHMYYAITYFGSNDSEIYRSDLNGEHRELIVSGFNQVEQLQLTVSTNHLYFIEGNLGTINRVNLDGTNLVQLLDTTSPVRRIEVDLINNAIYLYKSGGIYSIELDGSNEQQLTIDAASDFTLDLPNNHLYYSSTNPNLGLQRCDLAVQNCITLIPQLLNQTIIYNNKIITARARDLIQYDIDGTNPIVLNDELITGSNDYIDPINQQFYQLENSLNKINWSDNSLQPLIGSMIVPHGIAIDGIAQKAYIGSINGEISSSNHQNINFYDVKPTYTDIFGRHETRGIALDSINGYVYFAKISGSTAHEGVSRIKLDGSMPEEKILPSEVAPHDVALDLVNNKVYWSHDTENGPAGIRRANLDGSNIEQIITSNDNGIRGLDIDTVNQKMYWSDHKLNEIRYVDLNDVNLMQLTFATLTSKPHHVDIDEINNLIYWSQGITGSGGSNGTSGVIRSTNLANTPPVLVQDITENISNLPGTIRDIAVALECDHQVTNPSYSLSGTITGLETNNPVVLQNNNRNSLWVNSNGEFIFTTLVSDTSAYQVSVLDEPTSPSQTCLVKGGNSAFDDGSGTILGAPYSDIVITCAINSFLVGGELFGLGAGSVFLRNNTGDEIELSSNGVFQFPTALDDLSTYAVTVNANPTNPNQTCVVTGGSNGVEDGSGTLAGADYSGIVVTCTTIQYSVGVDVSGLATGNSVGFENNGEGLMVSTDGQFNFATALDDGSDYEVIVTGQPTTPNQTCQLTNSTGTIMGADINDVEVDCTINQYLIGGTATGLISGNNLILRNNNTDDLTVANSGDFDFVTAIDDLQGYTVSIFNQPNNPIQPCMISENSGNVAGINVTTVTIDCEIGDDFIYKDSFE